ncbi:c-type cytochrome [Bordetella bronchiseptica]|uniref:c-type cytochrome n=1 Tax=Bordetella bronchiseptica TaxID=518 RepID=UPI0009B88458|nr:c-type cytochrome [Bordetella bronchiseptica]
MSRAGPPDTAPMAAMPAGSADLAPPAAGVLAGLVLRPPRASWNGERYTGPRAAHVDDNALQGLPGIVRVLVARDFVGIVATRPELAQQAAARLPVQWRAAPPGADAHPLWQHGPADTDAPMALEQRYRWPAADSHGMSTWALAWWREGALTVWTAAAAPALRRELAALLDLPPDAVRVLAYGVPPGQAADLAALDTAADAALLSRAVGQPVRVAGSPIAWPAPASGAIRLGADFDAQGGVAALRIRHDGAGLARPSLARLLAGGAGAAPADAPPYRFGAVRLAADSQGTLPPGAARLPGQRAAQVFALESFLDEAAIRAGVDPVEYRLRHLDDARGAALIRQVAQQAGWQASGRGGRGFAYASVIDDSVDPPLRSWSAWVADVSVDPDSGSVALTRVVVGHDLEAAAAPGQDAPRIEQHLRDTAGRLLGPPAAYDDWSIPATPIAGQLPTPEVVRPARALATPAALAWSDTASLPAAAAVANAIFDATGIRLREPPFNGAQARRALSAAAPARRGNRGAYAWLGGIAAAAAGLVVAAWPWRPALAPIAGPEPGLYSAAAIERGRLVAAAGDCVVCHTAPGGAPNAGGLALDTPFGAIYTTNITPDVATGIGQWSYAAFERAMRQGIHRDGRQLYPAFPYTSFAKLSEADMQALYAYLMAQPPVAATPPPTRLPFPYNLRPLMAGWNALFHDARPYQPDPERSTLWNRGAYLVQGAGHCGACHTPRNSLGAERGGERHFLGGGVAEGWDAPALNALSRAPVPWTEQDLYAYLRTGFSARHGVAAGPMAPVVQSMAQLPDADVRAMAHYLSSLGPAADSAGVEATVQALERASEPGARLLPPNGERLFQGACAVCHETRHTAPQFGVRPSLALNTNLHSARPDNLIQVILHGIVEPANGQLGYMPAFGDSLDAGQIAELVQYMRARFAPGEPAWQDVAQRVRELSRQQ